jgi:selenoprotein W-related protein
VTDVTIEYCVPCDFRDRALDLQRAILTSLERELDSLTLEMGDHGVFAVRVDGDPVYDKDEDGDIDVDAVVRDVRAAL